VRAEGGGGGGREDMCGWRTASTMARRALYSATDSVKPAEDAAEEGAAAEAEAEEEEEEELEAEGAEATAAAFEVERTIDAAVEVALTAALVPVTCAEGEAAEAEAAEAEAGLKLAGRWGWAMCSMNAPITSAEQRYNSSASLVLRSCREVTANW
jgi:hypothetical protein